MSIALEPPSVLSSGAQRKLLSTTGCGAVILLALAATLGGVFGGPGLGDHEALVAQCARNMRTSGDWLVPEFLGTPFVRKPPLPYWLVAAFSYVLPDDTVTGLPVTTAAARLPSGLAGFGTVLLLWYLAGRMFGRRTGLAAAVLASSSLFFLMYSPNATAEMLLTFCCTWAFTHFWCAVSRQPGTDRSLWWRRLHLVGFYIALGVGMLAKGPAPLAMVALPLAAWWYTERPLRLLARQGVPGWRRVAVCFVRGIWPRTRAAFTQLWLLPGLVLFAAIFVPWMWAVAQRHPHAWDLWNWQYWQRAQGNYDDSKPRGPWYYLPYIPGLLAPWVFLLPEATGGPWLRWFARWHRPLLYAGLWALVGIAIMSAEPFKKPYYIAPAVPGLILLIAVVAERAFSYRLRLRPWMWWCWIGLGVALVAGLVAGGRWLQINAPGPAKQLMLLGVIAAAGLLLAAAMYLRGRGWLTFALVAVLTVGTFQVVWHRYGRLLDDIEKPAGLAAALVGAGAPRDAKVYWADSRPDARLQFYFNRQSEYMIAPADIVDVIVDRTAARDKLQEMVLDRAHGLLAGAKPVYLILERENYELGRQWAGLEGRVAGAVKRDPRRPDKDWLIVTNTPVK